MTTVLDIINRSLHSIGELDATETPDAQQAADGLIYFNDLVESLSNEGLMIYATTSDTITCTGAVSYTFGTGGTVNTARPIEVISAFYTLGGVDYPVELITREQYESIPLKTTTGGMPSYIYVSYEMPLAKVYVWPAASSGTITMSSNKTITTAASVSTVLSLPPGYERMLRLGMCFEMSPEYMLNNPQLQDMYSNAKRALKRTNSRPIVMNSGLPRLRNGSRYTNIMGGYY